MPIKHFFEGEFEVQGSMELEPVSTPPTGRSVNDVYLDDGTNTGSGNPGWRYLVSIGPDVWADVSLSTGTDVDAIHDNVAGEINAITQKTTPVSADLILIEDSADSNNKKKIIVGSLPSGDAVAVLDESLEMGAIATEIDIGMTTYDGSTGVSHTFKAIIEPSAAVTCEIRIYDRGPVAGPAVEGQLVAKLVTSTAGLQVLSETLTASGSPTFPDNNEIYNTDRMYQIRGYISGTLGDILYIGKVSLALV